MLKGGTTTFEVVLTQELEVLAIVKGGGGEAGWPQQFSMFKKKRGGGVGWGGGSFTLS